MTRIHPADVVRTLAARNQAEHNVAYAEAQPQGRVVATDDLVAVDIDSPLAFLNSIVVLRPHVDAEHLAAFAADVYGTRPHFVIDFFETLDLAAHGYAVGDAVPVMVRPPAPVPPPDAAVTVRRVTDDDALVEFERLVVVGMGLDPYADRPPFSLWGRSLLGHDTLRLYVGRVDGRPVACAACVATAEAAGVYAVVTLPDDRRRGYGAAVTTVALADAPDVPGVLSSSPLGFGVYRRLGFAHVADRRNWRFDGTAATTR